MIFRNKNQNVSIHVILSADILIHAFKSLRSRSLMADNYYLAGISSGLLTTSLLLFDSSWFEAPFIEPLYVVVQPHSPSNMIINNA